MEIDFDENFCGKDVDCNTITDENEQQSVRIDAKYEKNVESTSDNEVINDSEVHFIENRNNMSPESSTVNVEDQKLDCKTNIEQEMRAEMKSRFLWSISALNERKTKVSMYEGITVEGVCRGIDKDILNMHMHNMKTPFATYPYATIRLTDCFALNFDIEK